MSQLLLEEILTKLQGLPPDQIAALEKMVARGLGSPTWLPTAGPQREAYETLADETFYGGSAGSGKTSCSSGLP
jgi:hypothetical protein